MLDKNKIIKLLGIFIIASIVLTACGGGGVIATEGPIAPTSVVPGEPKDHHNCMDSGAKYIEPFLFKYVVHVGFDKYLRTAGPGTMMSTMNHIRIC